MMLEYTIEGTDLMFYGPDTEEGDQTEAVSLYDYYTAIAGA